MFQTKLGPIETCKGYWRAEQLNSWASCLNSAEKVSGLICKCPQEALSWSHRNLRGWTTGLPCALKAECLAEGALMSVTLPFRGPPGHRSVERICVFFAASSFEMPMNFRGTTSGEAHQTDPQPNWRYWMVLWNTLITNMCLMHHNLGWVAFSGHYGVIPIRSM